MLAIGGTPREVLDDPTVREFILSNLRDDLRTIDRYVHDDARVLDIPIVAFGGARDPIAAGDDLRAGRRATRGTFDYREFAGGHFYHLEDPTMFVDALREATEAILGYC
jgi:pyochelin biosynthetic protein PchC